MTQEDKGNSRNLLKNMESEETATEYKLKQFLDDVQKFTERSKKTINKNPKRKPVGKTKPLLLKRGLFENGIRSRNCPKGTENRARLRGNLNDLIQECPEQPKDMESISSLDRSSSEGSYELVNPESHKELNNSTCEYELPFSDKIDRCKSPENRFIISYNTPINNQKKSHERDLEEKYFKETLWNKCWEELENKKTASMPKFNEDNVDHLKTAKQKINDMLYESFLKNIRKYPSVLQKIFSSDEIKKLAQIVVHDKTDKSVQTEVLQDSLFSHSDIKHAKSVQKHFQLPFPSSPKKSGNSNNVQDDVNFFDLNSPNEAKTQENFLESLENQPDIFSPTGQINLLNCNASQSPSPLPLSIQQHWAPSTSSSPQRPKIISPLPKSFNILNWQSPVIPLNQNPKVNRSSKQLSFTSQKCKQRRKLLKKRGCTMDSPLQFHFPKRKKVTFSPHRL